MEHTLRLLPWHKTLGSTLQSLFQQAVSVTAARDYSAAQIAAWRAVDEAAFCQRLADTHTRIALLAQQPAGFISFQADGWIDLLFVHPDCQRRGIASALLRYAETVLTPQGVPTMATAASITARPFFAAHGFTLEQQQQVAVRGETLINYRMAKRLGEQA